MSDRATLVQFYVAFYNRAPDPLGLAFWQAACDNGLALGSIADLFVPQDETLALYPFLANPTEEGIRTFLQTVYQNLFNRDLDAAGETFWTDQVLASDAFTGEDSGNGLSLGQVVLSIITGAQGDDVTTLANKTEIALDWHDQAADDPDYAQTEDATAASRLALFVVDETPFSVVQGKVLNANFFEEDPFDTPSGAIPGNFNFDPDSDADRIQIVVNQETQSVQVQPNSAVLEDGSVVTAYVTADAITLAAVVRIAILTTEDELARTIDFAIDNQAIFPASSDALEPVVLALPNNEFAVVNVLSTPAGQQFAIYRFDAQGEEVADPVLAPGNGTAFAIGLRATAQDDGSIVLTFTQSENGNPDLSLGVFTTTIAPDGEIIVETERVNEDIAGNQQNPSVATLDDGTTLFVYESGSSVFGRLYEPNGDAGSEFLVPEFINNGQNLPHTIALGSDKFLVVFQTTSGEFDPLSTGISGVILDRNGDVVVNEFPVNQVTTAAQRSPVAAELSDGNFVVVYLSDESGEREVVGRIFDTDGNPVTDEFPINAISGGNEFTASVAASGNGFVVSFPTNVLVAEDFSSGHIGAVFFDNSGTPIAVEQPPADTPVFSLTQPDLTVNTFASDDQSAPETAELTNGNIVTVYNSDGILRYKVIDTEGRPIVNDAPVYVQTDEGQFGYDVASLPNGGFVIAASGERDLAEDTGLYIREFGSDGLPVNEEVAVNTDIGRIENVFASTNADGKLAITYNTQIGVEHLVTVISPGTGLVETTTPNPGAPNLRPQSIDLADDGTIGISYTSFGSGNLEFMYLDDDLSTLRQAVVGDEYFGFGAANAVLEDGSVFVVATRNTDNGLQIFGHVMAPDNTSSIFGITDSDAGSGYSRPSLVEIEDGLYFVVYSKLEGNGDRDIYGIEVDAINLSAGPEKLISSPSDGDQDRPDVTTSGDGFFVAYQNDDTNDFDPDGLNITGTFLDQNADVVDLDLMLLATTNSALISRTEILEKAAAAHGNAFDPNTAFIDAADSALGADFVGAIGPDSGFIFNPQDSFTITQLQPGEVVRDFFTFEINPAEPGLDTFDITFTALWRETDII
ncbi:MAG: hypothetical protein HRU30_21585 [Rhodobacteraceae bacterium]|nr:hypothetical protein [Paracoccaceae bacterium]